MKIIRNTGVDRLIDLLRPRFKPGQHLDLITPTFSLFAFAVLRDELDRLAQTRLLLPAEATDLALLGGATDRGARNSLQTRWLAKRCADWVHRKVELRHAQGAVPQGMVVLRDTALAPLQMAMGSTAFSTEGLGLTPGNPLSLIQATESADEAAQFSTWFDAQWATLQAVPDGAASLVEALRPLSEHRDPMSIYALMLHHVFSGSGEALDEDSVVKSATGIRNTVVWKKLFKFQRDGVVGAIDKLDRFGGCIIADSVGLGKTFEALAIIKYHELRNDRVLVLCPKRLRDNWTLYKANDRRNVLAADRFNYDVLNHTDLSRDGGLSGDIDLRHVNWGNYDLVVIDESHNFRNKKTRTRTSETRYDRLMRQIIKRGREDASADAVGHAGQQPAWPTSRTRSPSSPRATTLALVDHGIASIEATTRKAQKQFNRWLDLPEDASARRPA